MSGIYIHVPFCRKACHYCDFHFSTDVRYRQQMMLAMAKEAVLQQENFKNLKPETLYFGGGTPSLIETRLLETLVDTLRNQFDLSHLIETTLEANPEDLTGEKLLEFKSLGIDRLSIGVQTLDERTLQFLNRNHSGQQSLEALDRCRDAGYSNISVDLIFAIPGRTIDVLRNDLKVLLAFAPEHISTYGLTIEHGTYFGHQANKGKFLAVDEEQNALEFETIIETLVAAGYRQYEISNFCLPNRHSRHNSAYWKGEPYLGLGPGAHSFHDTYRQFNISNNHLYMQSIAENILPAAVEKLSMTDRINEAIMTALRTEAGIALNKLKEWSGYDLLKENDLVVKSMVEASTAVISDDCLRLTKKGKMIADKITLDLFLEP